MKMTIIPILLMLVILLSCNNEEDVVDPCAHLNTCDERNFNAIDYTLINNYHQAITISYSIYIYRIIPARIGKDCGTCDTYSSYGKWTVQVSDTLSRKTDCAQYYIELLTPDSVVNFSTGTPNGTIIINPDGTCSCN